MLDKWVSETKAWLKRPYDENGDVFDWVLFFGFMVAVSIMWTRVIVRVMDE